MQKVFSFMGATIGGWVGWWLGSYVGFFTAFVVSVIGTGFGIYLAYRVTRYYLG